MVKNGLHTPSHTSASQPSPDEVVEQAKSKIGIILAALMLTMLMSSLSQMIFGAALPTIVGELGGVEHMSWVISAFMAAMTIALPIFGKLGDMYGRKWLYILAIALFVTGSTIGGFASSMSVLIFGRAIQGFGAGGMMLTSQAIIAEVIPARERGKYMGYMGAVFGFSSVLGPVLGGWFTDGPGWRWAMWMNIPLGLAAITASTIVLKLRTGNREQRFDIVGTVFMSIATVSLILLTTWGGIEYDWGSPQILSLIAITVVSAAIFVAVELKSTNPLIPMQLFKNRNMVLTTASGVVIGIAMFGTLGYMPTYLQMVHTLTPTEAGLMMIPMMVGMLGTSITVGLVITRTGKYRAYPIVGMAIAAVGLYLFSQLTVDTPLVTLGIYFFIFGFGLGLVMQVLVLIVQNSFPIAVVGTATAANNFFRQIGGAVGAALVGSAFINNMKEELGTRLPAALQQLGPEGAVYAEQFSESGANKLTPGMVAQLPDALQRAVLESYNAGLTPVLLMLVPLAVLALLLLIPVREEKLKETVS